MLMDLLDFGMKPWDIEDAETGRKEIFVEDKTILREMYKLKNMYEKPFHQHQQKLQINSNNWNFGSVPPSLLKKKS